MTTSRADSKALLLAIAAGKKEAEKASKDVLKKVDTLLDERIGSIGVSDGRDGADGKDGKDGQDGVDGKDGRDGSDGRDGVDGQDGRDGQDGVDGQDGRDGKDGADGADGKGGQDGVGVSSAVVSKKGHLLIDLTNGTQVDAGYVIGPKGDKGDKGRTIIGGGGGSSRPAAVVKTWTDYVTRWDTAPVEVATLPTGAVFSYILQGVTRYRFVPDPYDAAGDGFYSGFDGSEVSGLIVARNG